MPHCSFRLAASTAHPPTLPRDPAPAETQRPRLQHDQPAAGSDRTRRREAGLAAWAMAVSAPLMSALERPREREKLLRLEKTLVSFLGATT